MQAFCQSEDALGDVGQALQFFSAAGRHHPDRVLVDPAAASGLSFEVEAGPFGEKW